MTKKDYEVIAGAINFCNYELRQHNGNGEVVAGVTIVAEELASRLEKNNPRFNRERFLTACGIGTVHKFSNGQKIHDPYNVLG